MKPMFEYEMPEIPEGHRWFVRGTAGGKKYRYLHLERKYWFFWVNVHKKMIDTGAFSGPFDKETVRAGRGILKEIKVDFNLPTGEVR
jgi:hypothetical protein